jgi:hypothetical protein
METRNNRYYLLFDYLIEEVSDDWEFIEEILKIVAVSIYFDGKYKLLSGRTSVSVICPKN